MARSEPAAFAFLGWIAVPASFRLRVVTGEFLRVADGREGAMRRRLTIACVMIATVAAWLPVVPTVRAAAATIPSISIGDVTISEGTATARTVSFPVALSRPGTAPVSVQYRIVADTATPGVDVDDRGGQLFTIQFNLTGSGLTPVVKYVNVTVLPDVVDESNEVFSVTLMNPVGATMYRGVGVGTILDDDPIGNGFLATVSDQSIVEGDAASRSVKFLVSLSQRAPATVSLDYSIVPFSAAATSDIATPAAPKRLTFTRGTSGYTPISKTVSVSVKGDLLSEGNETFAIVLSNPSVGVLLADARGIGTIIDDEPARRPLMGTAVTWPTLGNNSAYANIAGRRFDIVTPENEMKWDATEPTRGVYNFATSDAIVKFAIEHGQQVHGHALAWHVQNPAWLTAGNFTRTELIAILTQHINAIMTRYRGTVTVWDVVNEPIGDDALLRSSVWSQGIGSDYLDIAFFAARAADPTAKLYINDYNIEYAGAKADAMYNLVAGMVSRGVPIDGVGFQTHTSPGWTTTQSLGTQFARYTALGLDVAVTELDVRVPVPVTPASLSAQAATYQSVVDACLATTRCSAITTWGFTDAYSWIPSFFPGFGAALPWDAAFRPKPAYSALAPLLRN